MISYSLSRVREIDSSQHNQLIPSMIFVLEIKGPILSWLYFTIKVVSYVQSHLGSALMFAILSEDKFHLTPQSNIMLTDRQQAIDLQAFGVA
jgi:hypothetical protein